MIQMNHLKANVCFILINGNEKKVRKAGLIKIVPKYFVVELLSRIL